MQEIGSLVRPSRHAPVAAPHEQVGVGTETDEVTVVETAARRGRVGFRRGSENQEANQFGCLLPRQFKNDEKQSSHSSNRVNQIIFRCNGKISPADGFWDTTAHWAYGSETEVACTKAVFG
ncbi:hypothetical protein AaE_013977 [Aphanomyces astaci]|uniref:Uncharacterized protein n=1 Tax=Aphanomyces astaci TaxID=112090 RepID=A0A6A4Z9J7_APHAT|nr:hypothetical protein AaE_013977 [Aphanomyces astaci]